LAPQTNVPPTQPSAYLKVAEQYPSTSAAERAQIFAATGLFTDRKYAEAEREFSRFVKEHADSPWVAEAAYGVAKAQEAQNKLNEAQASYQNVATAYASSSVADEAKLSLARVFELRKQADQALRVYNELLVPRPGAQPGEAGNREAFQRKEALLRAHPELNTNAPTFRPAVSTLVTNKPAVLNTNAAPAAQTVVTNTPPVK
jgi:tetratricopeptide (TPR) repeat protein